MILLNFAHSITPAQLEQVTAPTSQPMERIIEVPSQVDLQQPLTRQAVALADAAGLSPGDWQTPSLLINPPSLNFVAAILVAELHGRCGYFPTSLRLRPADSG